MPATTKELNILIEIIAKLHIFATIYYSAICNIFKSQYTREDKSILKHWKEVGMALKCHTKACASES